jgi:hypothetical protein
LLQRFRFTLVVWFAVPLPATAQDKPSEPVRVEDATPKRTVRIHGTAVAVDKDGTAHADADGSLRIYHHVDGPIEATVRHGQWEAWCTKEDRFFVGTLELGGRSVALPRLPFAPPFDRSFELKGTWIGDHVVHVVDQATGAELDGIETVKEPEREGYARHPGLLPPGPADAKELRSPLRLTAHGHWFLRAPGHAWVDFDFMEGRKESEEDEETLELPAACKLVIDVKGFDPAGDAKLRIEPGNGSVEWLTLDPKLDPWPAAWKEGHIELDAFPPGSVHVRALLDFHRKPWFWHTVTLGEAVVTLAPDAPAHAPLVIGPPPAGLHEDGTVDRDGIVTLPDGKDRGPFTGDGSIEFQFVKVHRSEGSGRFHGTSWSGVFEENGDGSYDMSRKYVVPIEKGAFHLRPPYGTHMDVSQLVLDGKAIVLGPAGPLDGNPSLIDTTPAPIEIAVPGPALDTAVEGATTLHVVDATTKAELTHVEIVTGLEWPRSDCAHPGVVEPRNVLVRDGVSPLPLPAPRSSHGFQREGIYWVRAEGHAWARFKQETRTGGERTVALAPSVDLDVRLEPNVFAPKAVLRVRGGLVADDVLREGLAALGYGEGDDDEEDSTGASSSDELEQKVEEAAAKAAEMPLEAVAHGQPLLEAEPAADGTTHFEGLPRGKYSVSLELGEWFRQPTRFGITTVDGTNGGRVAVTLAVEPPKPAPDPVPLAGTLFLPPEWGRIDATLHVKPESQPNVEYNDWIKIDLKRMKRDEKTPGLYAWTAGKVVPGEFELSLGEFGFGRRIVVGAEGDTNQRIEIAPPADVEVHVVDEVTGEPAAVKQMLWYLKDGSLNSYADVDAKDGNASTFRFRAPIGALTLHVWDRPYELHAEDVEVRAGKNEFTLKLEKECGARLTLKSGATTILWDDEAYHVALVRIDGKGGNRGWGDDGTCHRVTVSSPGRYRVTFGRFPGFKPVAPREVTIGKGEMVEVEVDLEVER